MSTCENEKDLEKLLFDFYSQQPYSNYLLRENKLSSTEYWKREKDALSNIFGDKQADTIVEWAKNSGDFERKCRMNITENLIDDYFGSIIKYERKEERSKTIDECFKAMRKKVDEVFQRQTEERHEKDLSAYQQPFDCFSMGTIELEILSEVEKQMKGESK